MTMPATPKPDLAPDLQAEVEAQRRLFAAAVDLGRVRSQTDLTRTITEAARALTGADGVTVVLREGDLVHYVDEDTEAPLWKGQRFPASACISGWAMMQRTPACIGDIYEDPRIPHDAYRSTYVKSLVMVPMGGETSVGAIGAYWSEEDRADARSVRLLELLAEAAAVAAARVADWEHVESALEERAKFYAVAAHELRSPLSTVSLNGEIVRLALRAEDTAKAGHATERLMESVKGLERTLESMLEVVKVDQAPMLQRAPVELASMVERLLAGVRRQADAAGCALTFEAEEPVEGRWDGGRLEQVVHNLLSNAFKYGPGQPVTVRVFRTGSWACLSVRDQGVGIDRSEQARIFERFRRGRRTGGAEGLGVGLWLVRRLVEAHGGDIRVHSAAGRGAEFLVRLPLLAPVG